MSGTTAAPRRGARGHSGHRVGAWHGRAEHPTETVRKARELRKRGLSYRQISAIVGAHWRTVADWVNLTTRWAD